MKKKASKDLISIYKYIQKESSQNAVFVINSICDLVDSLELFPFKFPKKRFLNNENIRFAVIWSYKVVYAIDNVTILILRVFNTKQNPKKIKK